MRLALLAGLLLAAAAPAAAGQTWRTVTESRRHLGEDTLAVVIAFALGELRIAPADAPVLYRANLVYDDQLFEPAIHYDPARGRLRAGIERDDDHRSLDVDWDDRSEQRLVLGLSREVAVNLHVEFGAGNASLDLGGLAMVSARIQTGASESTIRFSEPNVATCRRLTFEVGAAEFRALQLGNARCERIRVSGGVGEILLDLSGAWPDGDHRVRADVGLGEVRVEVPRSAGVRVEIHKFLAGVDHPGFTKRGNYYYSANYEDAAVKLLVEVHATFGSIEIAWSDN